MEISNFEQPLKTESVYPLNLYKINNNDGLKNSNFDPPLLQITNIYTIKKNIYIYLTQLH